MSSSSSSAYGALAGDMANSGAEEGFQYDTYEATRTAPSSSSSSSSSSSGGSKRVFTTAVAVVMALVGASILVTYGRGMVGYGSGDLNLVQGPGGTYGRPGGIMKSATVITNGPMKSADGVGNVIFDYETMKPDEYTSSGQTIIECLQVGGDEVTQVGSGE
jgi:hypothetical protein